MVAVPSRPLSLQTGELAGIFHSRFFAGKKSLSIFSLSFFWRKRNRNLYIMRLIMLFSSTTFLNCTIFLHINTPPCSCLRHSVSPDGICLCFTHSNELHWSPCSLEISNLTVIIRYWIFIYILYTL